MDLRLFGRVMKRHPFVVTLGVILAIALSALTLVRVTVSPAGATYRQHAAMGLLHDPDGHPAGVSLGKPERSVARARPVRGRRPPRGPRRALFAVRHQRPGHEDHAAVRADQRIARGCSGPGLEEQLLERSTAVRSDRGALAERGRSASPRDARGERAQDLHRGTANRRGESSRAARVLLQMSTAATAPTLYKKRSKALPIVVLLSLLIATVLVAFVLENIKAPREDAERAGSDEAPDRSGISKQHECRRVEHAGARPGCSDRLGARRRRCRPACADPRRRRLARAAHHRRLARARRVDDVACGPPLAFAGRRSWSS